MGGRIFTLKIADYLVRKFDEVYIRDDITNSEKGILSKINYEVGAGRFSQRHKNLTALFNELGISREKISKLVVILHIGQKMVKWMMLKKDLIV